MTPNNPSKPGRTIIGFPIPPLPVPGLPGAELAAPYRMEHLPDDPDAGDDGNVTFAQWKLKCPVCGLWGDIDDDQLHGRVSVDHTDALVGHGSHRADGWGGSAVDDE